MEPGAWYESARVPAEPAVHAIIAAPGCTIIPIDALTSVKQKKTKNDRSDGLNNFRISWEGSDKAAGSGHPPEHPMKS